jgi:hypothetical protein
MGSRERKRVTRRKRKLRTAERRVTDEAARDGDRAGTPIGRSELKDREAREALEPLREGERPAAVTVGAVVATLIALVFWVSAVVSVATEAEVEGSQPSTGALVLFAAVLTLMAYGMWRARYWAVLALLMLSAGLGLVQVTTVLQAIATLLVLAGAATLFYFMVKAMARIQMPQRLPRE